MGTASRFGTVLGDPVDETWMFPRLELDQAARGTTATIMGDWIFGATAPSPVQIPYLWLSTPYQFRTDLPFTSATVDITGGDTARRSDETSQTEFGDNEYTATLDSRVPADGPSLARHVMFYYATQPGQVPRRRFTLLRFVLNARSQSEQWTILQVGRGDRFVITGAPATSSASLLTQVVDGIGHGIGDQERVVAWLTSPVIGEVDGTPGPYFRLDSSMLDGPDKIPF